MKNKLISIIAALGILFSFTGCTKKIAEKSSQLKVMTTIFPLWDWTENVIKDTENVSLDLLIKNGTDLHSYQPSTSDIIRISSCDVLIYAGGNSDSWIKDVIRNPVNKNLKAVNLMESLSDSLKEEELKEGMEDSGEEETEGPEYDEHIWLSLENAEKCTEIIAAAVSEKSEESKTKIEENAQKYINCLEELKNSSGPYENTIIVCDRFPFRYLTEETGINYYAAFNGCSAETEASFETIAFLSKKLQEQGLKKVYVTESSDRKIARTVLKNAGLSDGDENIVVLDSLQSATMEQYRAGKTYLSAMKENLQKVGK